MLQSEVAVMKDEELEGGDFRHGSSAPVPRDPSTGTAGELMLPLESLPALSNACQATGCESEFMERLDGATVQTMPCVRDGTHLYTGGPVYLILGTVINILLMENLNLKSVSTHTHAHTHLNVENSSFQHGHSITTSRIFALSNVCGFSW